MRSKSPSVAKFNALAQLRQFFDQQHAPEILYFGDSVVERVSHDDSDKRTLGEMVVSRLGGTARCATITHSAYHPAVFYALLRALRCMKYRPSTLILPVNMRCFSPQWDLRPGYQFEAELAAIERYVENPNQAAEVVVSAVESLEQLAAYDATKVDYPSSKLTRIGEFRELISLHPLSNALREARLSEIFKFHYTHQLAVGHRKLALLRQIFELLTLMNMRALIYVTPINYEAGALYAGPTFVTEYMSTVDVLKASIKPYERTGLAFADLSLLLGARYFVHQDIANEHLNQGGRHKLTTELARHVEQLLLPAAC